MSRWFSDSVPSRHRPDDRGGFGRPSNGSWDRRDPDGGRRSPGSRQYYEDDCGPQIERASSYGKRAYPGDNRAEAQPPPYHRQPSNGFPNTRNGHDWPSSLPRSGSSNDGREYARDHGREYGRDHGREYGREYGRDSSSNRDRYEPTSNRDRYEPTNHRDRYEPRGGEPRDGGGYDDRRGYDRQCERQWMTCDDRRGGHDVANAGRALPGHDPSPQNVQRSGFAGQPGSFGYQPSGARPLPSTQAPPHACPDCARHQSFSNSSSSIVSGNGQCSGSVPVSCAGSSAGSCSAFASTPPSRDSMLSRLPSGSLPSRPPLSHSMSMPGTPASSWECSGSAPPATVRASSFGLGGLRSSPAPPSMPPAAGTPSMMPPLTSQASEQRIAVLEALLPSEEARILRLNEEGKRMSNELVELNFKHCVMEDKAVALERELMHLDTLLRKSAECRSHLEEHGSLPPPSAMPGDKSLVASLP